MDSLLDLDSFCDEFAKLSPSTNVRDSYGETFHSNWEGNKYFGESHKANWYKQDENFLGNQTL